MISNIEEESIDKRYIVQCNEMIRWKGIINILVNKLIKYNQIDCHLD